MSPRKNADIRSFPVLKFISLGWFVFQRLKRKDIDTIFWIFNREFCSWNFLHDWSSNLIKCIQSKSLKNFSNFHINFSTTFFVKIIHSSLYSAIFCILYFDYFHISMSPIGRYMNVKDWGRITWFFQANGYSKPFGLGKRFFVR